jgi:hypothetical protein
LFCDHATSHNALGFYYTFPIGADFITAAQIGAKMAGLETEDFDLSKFNKSDSVYNRYSDEEEERKKRSEIKYQEKRKSRQEVAQVLWSKSKPIRRTLGEKYLVEIRGLPKSLVE